MEIPDKSTWEHVNFSWRWCTVLGSNENKVSIRYSDGEFDIWERTSFLDYFRLVDDRPPKPTPAEDWAMLISDSKGWHRYRRKADAEGVAAENGGGWIAPVVPRMDRAVWVPGVES